MTVWISVFCNSCGYVETFEIEGGEKQGELAAEKCKQPCFQCGSAGRTWV